MTQIALRKLFSAGRIGSMELKNRVVMAAMDLVYDNDGFVSPRTEAFYAERAKGGAALLIIGGVAIAPDAVFTGGMMRVDSDDHIAGFRRMAATLHRHGAKVAMQLLHAGRDAMVDVPLAPSAVASRLTKRVPRAMTIEDIKDIVDQFGRAALRAREAGFDAVEVMGSSGFIVSQFMSPVTNKRDDEYGGDLDGRLRFALEVIASVREHAGADFPLIFRHTGDDFIPGGHTLAEARLIAPRLQAAGVDAIDLQVGWEEAAIPTVYSVVPPGAYGYLAQGLKEVVDVPVIACNRINDPFVAERILREGKADFVAMARALMADPYLPAKAAEGRFDDINLCIACNQGCLDKIFSSNPAGCLVNPEAGRELELTVVPAPTSKKVVVVGGGPAGLEAARVLALRGHQVKLYERQAQLGGQLALAANSPSKAEFKEFVRYLVTQVQKSGVTVCLGQPATPELILAEHPDAVIVAIGGEPMRPEIPGVTLPHVVLAQDILSGKADAGRRVVIIGARGTACDVALLLARQTATPPEAAMFLASWGAIGPQDALALSRKSPQITMVRRGGRPADDIGRTVRWILMKELTDHGIQIVTGVEYEEINQQGVVVSKDGQRQLLEADTVVLATGLRPRAGLYEAIAGRVAEAHVVGDAKEVRDALAAVYEASALARSI